MSKRPELPPEPWKATFRSGHWIVTDANNDEVMDEASCKVKAVAPAALRMCEMIVDHELANIVQRAAREELAKRLVTICAEVIDVSHNANPREYHNSLSQPFPLPMELRTRLFDVLAKAREAGWLED